MSWSGNSARVVLSLGLVATAAAKWISPPDPAEISGTLMAYGALFRGVIVFEVVAGAVLFTRHFRLAALSVACFLIVANVATVVARAVSERDLSCGCLGAVKLTPPDHAALSIALGACCIVCLLPRAGAASVVRGA